jgi:hypothetical protein
MERKKNERFSRGRPIDQASHAVIRRCIDQRLVEPCIESCRRRLAGPVDDTAGVVEAEPTSNDQHPLVAQRRDQLANTDMLGWIEIRLHGELDERQLRLRIQDMHQREGPVVIAPLRV